MMKLQKFIEHERKLPLSRERIQKMVFRKNLRYKEYGDLKHSDRLRQLLPEKISGLLILYDNAQNPDIGHYVLLYRTGGNYHYFDPTGIGLRRMTRITGNNSVLVEILAGEDVSFNSVKYQKVRGDIQTCGRHVACRYNFCEFNKNDYHALMRYRGIPYDDLVTLLTLPNDLSHWKGTLAEEKKRKG